MVAFLPEHRSVSVVALNGGKAAAAFRRRLADDIVAACGERVAVYELPSTSAANTRYTYDELRIAWSAVLVRRMGPC